MTFKTAQPLFGWHYPPHELGFYRDFPTPYRVESFAMSMLICPECKKLVSEHAEACPHCGLPMTPERIEEMKAAHEKQMLLGGFIGGGIFLVIVFFCAGGFGSSSSSSYQPRRNYSVAEQVRTIEGNASRHSVSSYDRSLKRLSQRFSESESMIASRTIKAKDLLAQRGIHRSLAEIMSGMEYVSQEGTLGITYAEMLATYIALEESNRRSGK